MIASFLEFAAKPPGSILRFVAVLGHSKHDGEIAGYSQAVHGGNLLDENKKIVISPPLSARS